MTDHLVLEAKGLEKSLGGKPVVRGIDLTCAAGEVLGLLGPNGAGKTTTLRMCYGYLRADRGTVRIAGHDLAHEPDLARQRLGVCTQDDTFDADFTVRGNLVQTGRYFRPRQPDLAARIEKVLDRFGLGEYAAHKPDTLSGGYKRRLMIARSIIHQPSAEFLDEPTTGLDPQARVAVWELISALRAEGLGIVLTTHYMDEAARLSDRLQIIQAGRVRASGSPSAVLGDIVGEHVILLPAGPSSDAALAWFRQPPPPHCAVRPEQVLGHWHVPLDGRTLAAFVAGFPDLGYEVRPPTLDDLFHALWGRAAHEHPLGRATVAEPGCSFAARARPAAELAHGHAAAGVRAAHHAADFRAWSGEPGGHAALAGTGLGLRALSRARSARVHRVHVVVLPASLRRVHTHAIPEVVGRPAHHAGAAGARVVG